MRTIEVPGTAEHTGAFLGGAELSPAGYQQVIGRIFGGQWERFTDQQANCGYCAKPVRLHGSVTTIDKATGEVLSRYDTANEVDGVTYVRCGNRRAAVCPSCSHEYKGDMWHLLAAGAGGGMKGVPASVGYHPQLFVTLTAPSFGPVHTTRSKGQCRPLRRGQRWLCQHGNPSWCSHRHGGSDPRLGQPLCADCYDYSSHVVWQWHAPELWRRFTIALHRELAAHLGIARSKVRDYLRVSFAKVAEFQRRAVVHFHAIIRLDGPATSEDRYPAPVVPVDANMLAELVRAAVGKVTVDAPATFVGDSVRRLRFGAQLDARPVRLSALEDSHTELSPHRVAAYIAKYATKACEDFGIPSGITGSTAARRLGVNEHACRVIDTAARIAGSTRNVDEDDDDPYAGLRRWLHMLGFRGHFATKSRRYSTTLGRLRSARRRWQVAQLRRSTRNCGPVTEVDHGEYPDEDETTLVVGSWVFAGIGWCTEGDAALAAESAALAREYQDEQRTKRRAAAATSSVRPSGSRLLSG